MFRCASAAVAVALSAVLGCAVAPPESAAESESHTRFAGTWKSVTPSAEFVRLTLASKSSERDVLGARLTFSGVYWEGDGRIDGDSLVANMAVPGVGSPSAVLVARVYDGGKLEMRMRSGRAEPLAMSFIREH